MKRTPKRADANGMRDEYDFTGGVRGKYAKQYAEGTNIVVIDPEIAEFFPDSKSVNDALRMLAAFIKQKRREPAAGH